MATEVLLLREAAEDVTLQAVIGQNLMLLDFHVVLALHVALVSIFDVLLVELPFFEEVQHRKILNMQHHTQQEEDLWVEVREDALQGVAA